MLGGTRLADELQSLRIEAFTEDDIMNSEYTVHTVDTAVWSFLRTECYEEAVVRVVNTTGPERSPKMTHLYSPKMTLT